MIGSALLCLSLTIFHEARSLSIEDQIGVAAVVVNRSIEEDSKSICETVYKPSAFSWTLDKRNSKVSYNTLKNDLEKKAFLQAKQIAHLYLQGKLKNPVGTRTYFNKRSMGKRFKTPNEPIRLSSSSPHIFY